MIPINKLVNVEFKTSISLCFNLLLNFWNLIPLLNIILNSPFPNLEIDFLFFIISSKVSSIDLTFIGWKIIFREQLEHDLFLFKSYIHFWQNRYSPNSFS